MTKSSTANYTITKAVVGPVANITINVVPATAAAPPLTSTISGVVTDAAGDLLSGQVLNVLVDGAVVGTATTDANGAYSTTHTFVTAKLYHVSTQAANGVSSASVPVTVNSPPPPSDLITMSPSGNISLVVPVGANSVSQVVTGRATLKGAGVPNLNLYTFVNGVQIPGPVVTDTNGNYSTTIVFQPSSFPANFTVDIADNNLNN